MSPSGIHLVKDGEGEREGREEENEVGMGGNFSKGGFRLFPAHRYTGEENAVACQISI